MVEEKLGFKDLVIGMNSTRSGGAMEFFLTGISKTIIQCIGRWASYVFL